MADLFNKNDERTDYCGTLRESDIGRSVTVCGWVGRQRDLGSLIFIDLRDRTGIVQLAFDENSEKEVFDKAFACRSEFVLSAKGTVRMRSSVNNEIPTGKIEIFVTEMKILSAAKTPPFEISDSKKAKDELALRYRYLDLRRPELQKNLKLRHEVARIAREYFYENGFYEIETPMMIKSTPEGARDYLVPSRVHNGKFYALPQSPQIYKQLLMVAGFDRYVQIARCFRDEDLRADRQPEFTQIDLEMSFATQEDIMNMNEGFIDRLYKELFDIDLPAFPRMTYADAMNFYGTDKPDTRYGMKIKDISSEFVNSAFTAFAETVKNGGSVRAIVAENSADILTRKEIDKLTEHAKGIGARGLAYIRWTEDAPSCSFAKFLSEDEMKSLISALSMKKGDTALICADQSKIALPVLGALRGIVARKLDIIPKGVFNFLWITEFPFFEWNEEEQHWDAMHHPFTMPLEECLPYLESDPASVRANCYDMVLNGIELLSGSIRITDWQLQEKMFDALGLTKEEIEAKFGFLVDAYKFGAPPHGGSGMGLDRLVMQISEAESLRDVLAFPKVQNASELMSDCPSPVSEKDLNALGIKIAKKEN